MWVRHYFHISPGNYTVKDIVNQQLIQLTNQLKDIKNPRIIFNVNLQKVTFLQESNYSIVSFTESSVLQLLGLSKQTTTIVTPGKPTVEYIVFEANRPIRADLTPQNKRLTGMIVYSDIVELSLVGDTQAALLGFLPTQSDFGDQPYW